MNMATSALNSDDADEAILMLAAEWRARKDAGLTPDEERELIRWLEANPKHEDYFHQMGSTWDFMDVAQDANPSRLGLSEETRAKVEGVKPVSRIPGWSIGLAAAAALAFAWIGWTTWLRPSTAPGEQFQQSAEVATGFIKRMDLPDGSVIRLNSESHVEVAYSGTERAVTLVRGEAHFEVAKNPQRPFVVSARGAAVRAVGTAFNVALKNDSVEVLVTSGKVSVAPPPEPAVANATPASLGEPAFLVAGEKMVLSLQAEAVPVKATLATEDVTQALAWQDRRLEFDAAPLSEIVAEFNRFNVHQIVIAGTSPELARMEFAGSFRADDPETFIKLIRTRTSIAVERNERQTVLRSAR